MGFYRKRPVVIEARRAEKMEVIHTLEGDLMADPGDMIITGVQGEQYPCKPDIFSQTYVSIAHSSDQGFDWAIQMLKAGQKVSRSGWNGKHQYVILGHDFTYDTARTSANYAEHTDIGSKALVFVGTSGAQVGWLASQADMLAEDWGLAE